jgi:hypothetical protein
MEIAAFSLGEGKIVEKLLSELSGDGTLKSCIKTLDRPLIPSDTKLTAFVPKLDNPLKEFIKNLEQLTEVEIYSEDCDDFKNCNQIEGFYPLEALKKFFKKNHEILLAEKLENFQPKIEGEEFPEILKEKLSFYIPLTVAKRESISYAWKYYLSLQGIPCVEFLYPAEKDNFLNNLSNTAFRDKVFPLLVGTFEKTFLSKIKERGFVPYKVKPKTNQKLLEELELIYTAKVVSEQVFKP